MQVPAVQLGKPEKTDKFDLYNVDGVDVYLRKGIQVRNDTIHIFMRKFLWIKDLAVDGVSINY